MMMLNVSYSLNGRSLIKCLIVLIMAMLVTLDENQNTNPPDSVIYSHYQKRKLNQQKKPHILFIVADDLGYNDVGYHGSEINTPNIDALAMGGVRLENYYVQRLCTPTRGQLLSGRYEIRTGLHTIIRAAVPKGLPLDSPTIADKLKEAGYATHLVGKWHLGFYKKEYLPTYRGFDSFFGIATGHADHYTYNFGCCGGMQGTALIHNDKPADMKKYTGKYSTLMYADKVKEIIREHRDEKPLFMLLSYQAPHGPIQVPEKYTQQYKENINMNKNRKTFGGMVSCLDETIGDIVQTMKDKGMWEDTVLIFTSDNGGFPKKGSSNIPLRGHKGGLWEGGVRVVGFIHSKLLDKSMVGTTSHELMHVTDWFPTLVNLAGGTLDGTKPLDGYDQWSTIVSGTNSPRTEILHYIDPDAYTTKYISRAAIRVGDWKLVIGQKSKWGNSKNTFLRKSRYYIIQVGSILKSNQTAFLANIKHDPSERTDLSSKMPEKVEHMLNRIEHYRKEMIDPHFPGYDFDSNPHLHGGFWLPWRR